MRCQYFKGAKSPLYWSGNKPKPNIWIPHGILLYMASPWHYRQASNISRTLVDNKIVDYSDVVGASPVGAAPTTPSFST